MINDTIDIIDAFIINFGIEFVVSPTSDVDKFELIDSCVRALRQKYSTHLYIGEPISISEIYKELSKVRGVLDVVNVRITNKTGGNYSSVDFNINKNLSPAGDYVMVPKNAVAELKFPLTDIKGRVR